MTPEEKKPVVSTCLVASINVAIMIWAVLRSFSVMTAIVFLAPNILLMVVFGMDEMLAGPSACHLVLIAFLALLVDLPFQITLIVGICQKSYAILRTMYYYEMYAVLFEALTTLVILYVVYTEDPDFSNPGPFLFIVAAGLMLLSLDVAVTLSLKCKLVMMRNSELPEFPTMTDHH